MRFIYINSNRQSANNSKSGSKLCAALNMATNSTQSTDAEENAWEDFIGIDIDLPEYRKTCDKCRLVRATIEL